MTWLENILLKEAAKRRFSPEDKVRYFTEGRKGKGRGIVLTPNFAKGTVRDYNPETRRYKIVDDDTKEELHVHPRNMMPEYQKPSNIPPVPSSAPPAPAPMAAPMPMSTGLPLAADGKAKSKVAGA